MPSLKRELIFQGLVFGQEMPAWWPGTSHLAVTVTLKLFNYGKMLHSASLKCVHSHIKALSELLHSVHVPLEINPSHSLPWSNQRYTECELLVLQSCRKQRNDSVTVQVCFFSAALQTVDAAPDVAFQSEKKVLFPA